MHNKLAALALLSTTFASEIDHDTHMAISTSEAPAPACLWENEKIVSSEYRKHIKHAARATENKEILSKIKRSKTINDLLKNLGALSLELKQKIEQETKEAQDTIDTFASFEQPYFADNMEITTVLAGAITDDYETRLNTIYIIISVLTSDVFYRIDGCTSLKGGESTVTAPIAVAHILSCAANFVSTPVVQQEFNNSHFILNKELMAEIIGSLSNLGQFKSALFISNKVSTDSKKAQQKIGVPVHQVDFEAHDTAAQTINDSLTPGFIASDQIDSNTVLFLANYVQLKDQWQNAFKKGTYKHENHPEISVFKGMHKLHYLKTKHGTQFVALMAKNSIFIMRFNPENVKHITRSRVEKLLTTKKVQVDCTIPTIDIQSTTDWKNLLNQHLPNFIGTTYTSNTIPGLLQTSEFSQTVSLRVDHAGYACDAKTKYVADRCFTDREFMPMGLFSYMILNKDHIPLVSGVYNPFEQKKT